jgi:hypothetical protein
MPKREKAMQQKPFNLKLSRPFTNFIVAGVLCLPCLMPAAASQRVDLTWKPSPNPNVAGYQIYYGPASRNYTNSSLFGKVTKGTIAGLLEGATYYFSAKTKNSAGVESAFSNEASYAVPATALNIPPTLQPIANVVINRNATAQTISLTGISSGAAGENQAVKITASSSNKTLLPNPTITYTSPNSTGTLTFKPAGNKSGFATVTVLVNDGGKSNNIIAQRFTVTVLASANAKVVLRSGSKSKTMDAIGTASLQDNELPTSAAASQIQIAKESRRQFSTQSPRVFSQSPRFYKQSTDQLSASASPAAILTPIESAAKGQFTFQVTGVPSDTYVIQATDDLVHWFPVHTNVAPFTFTDTNAALLPRRFYRTFQPGS